MRYNQPVPPPDQSGNNHMTDVTRFVRVDFRRFKAFDSFTLHLRTFNVLVGPNNAGKSTILTAFRILAAAMRRAFAKKPTMVPGPNGRAFGYTIELGSISVAEENIFFDYDDSTPAKVTFQLSNGNKLVLFFPEQGTCYLFADAQTGPVTTPKAFRKEFNCAIGFVPILGPVEHNEPLFEKEAARLALFSYRAARNFRNIWHHFPDRFDEFRTLLIETWPGMDITPPRVDYSYQKARLHMFCPENRIPRELFWAGFGFQVWCQMLTHLIQSRDVSLFLIDEPDIYLHSDLQRQLLGLLRTLGPDILIATHSTEIISEAETDDIVLVNKLRKSAKRIKQPSELNDVFSALGSNLNPILTQLTKTRRAVFVEGNDFQILGKYARKIGLAIVANRSEFAVIPVDGFNPERIINIKSGIEAALGGKISAAAILDRDYRTDSEILSIEEDCASHVRLLRIHRCKEVENFLLIPAAIDRAAARRVLERNKRAGKQVEYEQCAEALLSTYAESKKGYVTAQFLASFARFERKRSPRIADETLNERALVEFEMCWMTPLQMIPGKGALAAINGQLQEKYAVTVTPTDIINSVMADEVPSELRFLLQDLAAFASS